jgi:hypothetical protein
MEVIVGQVPFSRHSLQTKLRLKQPTRDSLLTVEADSDLYQIARGDIVLIDRTQATLALDGIYLLDHRNHVESDRPAPGRYGQSGGAGPWKGHAV